MKHSAKLLALVLALVLVLSLAACKKAEEVKAPAAVPANSAAETTAPEPETAAPETAPATEPEETDPIETESPDPVNGNLIQGENDPALIGVWQGEVSIDQMMAVNSEDADTENLQMFQSLVGDAPLRMNFEFTEDGEAIFSIDPVSVDEMYEAIFTNLPTILPSLYGVSEEEFAAMLQEQGMTLDDFMDLMRQQLDKDALTDSLGDASTSGYYRVSGDRIYVNNDADAITEHSNYMVYRISGNTLTLVELVSEDDDADLSNIQALLPWELTRQN